MPGRGLPTERFGQGVWDVTTDYGGGTTTTVGHGSVATPGGMKALDLAHQRSGKAPWREVVQPAIEVARNGFPLSRTSGYYLGYTHEIIFGWHQPSHGVVHDDDGSVIKAGTHGRDPRAGRGARADRPRRRRDHVHRRARRAAHPRHGRERRHPHRGGPGRVRGRRTPGADGPAERLAPGDQPAAGRRWRRGRRDAGACSTAYRPTAAGGSPSSSGWSRCSTPYSGSGWPSWTRRISGSWRAEAAGPRRGRRSAGAELTQYGDGLGGRRRGRRVRDHGVVRLRLGRTDAGHRDLAEQRARRAGAAARRSAQPRARHAAHLEHGAERRPPRTATARYSRSARPGRTGSRPRWPRSTRSTRTAGCRCARRSSIRGCTSASARTWSSTTRTTCRCPARPALPTRPMPPHSMYFGGVAAAFWDPADGLLAVGDPRRTGMPSPSRPRRQ